MRSNTSFPRTVPAIPSATRRSWATIRTIAARSETTDPLGNRTTAEHDYRVLQPFRITDPNGNRSEVAFDTLGLVAGTAVMGKATETQGRLAGGIRAESDATQQRQEFLADPLANAAALLGQATTRIVYDLIVIARRDSRLRRHAGPRNARQRSAAGRRTQGAGEPELLRWLRPRDPEEDPGRARPVVEGGPVVSPRWVGSGWTIFNNKGKPVKQYEPFFDDTHAFRFDISVGVSSTLFYDPVERVVATLHPNHTWEKVVFDPWRQETWDVNDTVLIADPKTDPDVGEFFRRLAESDYLPTWYAQRASGSARPEQSRTPPPKTAIHAATPSVAHADSLGRTFLTIAHNRFETATCAADPLEEEYYATRVVFDIEGNQREVIDAKDRVVMRYDYDMLGTTHPSSQHGGGRALDAERCGGPADLRLGQPGSSVPYHVRCAAPAHGRLAARRHGPERVLIGRTVYGESQPNPEANNLRGRSFSSSIRPASSPATSTISRAICSPSQRQLARSTRRRSTGRPTPALEPEIFTSSTTYDALNRPVSVTTPDDSVYRPTFNEANLLERWTSISRGAHDATPFVTNIDYDAKGQRALIEYGNGVRTTYEYDPLTFRLDATCKTARDGAAAAVQDLSYTYDPAGNITHIRDDAQQTIYFNNQVVTQC